MASSSSSRDPRPTQDDEDDDDPEDKLPLSQVLRIGGNQEKPREEEEEEEEMANTRKDSDGERFKRMKGRPMHVKDYVKHCAGLINRMINVGDIVWVNRRWPGLVQKRGQRKATVSLYGSEEKPCKIRLSEVYTFEEHFVSIPTPISNELSYAIDCALEEFGRRFVLGVMCPCQASSMKKANDDEAFVVKKKEFQPKDVLRFVLGRAVSACVDHEKKLSGAKMSAQVYTFRRFMYGSTDDDERYRQEMRLSESNSSSTDDDSEPDMRDNLAGKETSSEMVSEDSYKEKGTFSPPDISALMLLLLTKNKELVDEIKKREEKTPNIQVQSSHEPKLDHE